MCRYICIEIFKNFLLSLKKNGGGGGIRVDNVHVLCIYYTPMRKTTFHNLEMFLKLSENRIFIYEMTE